MGVIDTLAEMEKLVAATPISKIIPESPAEEEQPTSSVPFPSEHLVELLQKAVVAVDQSLAAQSELRQILSDVRDIYVGSYRDSGSYRDPDKNIDSPIKSPIAALVTPEAVARMPVTPLVSEKPLARPALPPPAPTPADLLRQTPASPGGGANALEDALLAFSGSARVPLFDQDPEDPVDDDVPFVDSGVPVFNLR